MFCVNHSSINIKFSKRANCANCTLPFHNVIDGICLLTCLLKSPIIQIGTSIRISLFNFFFKKNVICVK